MCEFVSWLEYKGKIYFLSDKELKSRRGKELSQYGHNKDNWRGHWAICWYYGIERRKSIRRECEDFSTPANFPEEICTAIRAGQMTMFRSQPAELLSDQAWEQYKAIRVQAWEQREAIRVPAWEQYEAIRVPAWEQREAIRVQAWEQYEAIRVPAWEQYEAITAQAFWKLFKKIKNRAEAWK
jgi:hypothetical protein